MQHSLLKENRKDAKHAKARVSLRTLRLCGSLLLFFFSLNVHAQFSGGNGSGYSSGGYGNAVGVCNSSVVLTVHTCDNYLLPSGAQTVSLDGTYYDTIPNMAGCDSAMIIQLTLSHSTSHSQFMQGCDNIVVNGITYTSSGNYSQFLVNSQGCDSTLFLQLSIPQNTSSSLTLTHCGDFVYHGQTYSNSRTYMQTLVNSAGCDSVVTLNLTILPFNPAVVLNGNTLNAQQAGATYQWLDCNNNFSPIVGETGQSYSPSNAGNYAVALTFGNCTDTSTCVNVNLIGVEDGLSGPILLYPNPTAGKVMVDFGRRIEQGELTLMDMTGRVITSQPLMDVEQIELEIVGAAGLYLVGIRMEETHMIFMRVVKE